jgi:DNA-binding GntR family transcriptional regulator
MDLDLARQAATSNSLQDRIRALVEDEILSGQRAPGSVIDEKAVAARFHASRTPVREALLVLAVRGLVHIAPRSGIYVRRASAAELLATLEALAELEVVLAGLAAKRATALQKREMKEALKRASAYALADDREAYASANAVLHESLYASACNPVLVEQVRAVRRTLAAYRASSMDKPGRLKLSDAEHRTIVGAILAADEAGARQAMREHIDVGAEAMIQLVQMAQASDESLRLLARRSIQSGPKKLSSKPSLSRGPSLTRHRKAK